MKLQIGLVGVVCSLLLVGYAAERSLPVIPTPQKVEWRDYTCSAQERQPVSLRISRGLTPDDPAIRWLREELAQAWRAQLTTSAKAQQPVKIIQLVLDSTRIYAPQRLGQQYLPEMMKEGYFLNIGPDTITIAAPRYRGVFYGIATLVQLLRADSYQLPGVLICDYPRFAWRGVSDDLARGQVSTMANFQKIIRFLAEYKYNIYMPYFEDLLCLERYPSIGMGRGALTREEVRELQDYARQWQVEIIPIYQTLGHFENILNQPEFMAYADFPGAASLNVLSDDAREFLFNMLDEVIPWFDSPFFHIGADESWDVGMGATREAAAQLGVAKLHADHYQKVYQKVREHGKQVLMYGDVILRHPEILSQIPKDIRIVDWHYLPTDTYPSVRQFADSGFQVLVSPAVHNWHNPFPNMANSWLNIGNIARAGYLQGAAGMVISGWGDFGSPNLRELNYLGYAYGAEAAWNPLEPRYASINQRFGQQYFGLDDTRFNALVWHLNAIANQTNFKEIWRQPFYSTDEQVYKLLPRALLLQQHCTAALELLPPLTEATRRNKDDFAYYTFGARLGDWMARRLIFAREVEVWRSQVKQNPALPIDATGLDSRCSQLIYELVGLEEEYKDLWLRSNRPANLSRILNLFRQQRAYFEEARDSLSAGKADFPVELTARFIGLPSSNGQGKPIYLRKSFTIDNIANLQGAQLQLIANSDATIYLNGRKIGRVVATRSLSLVVENQRVGWWDVLPQLSPGQNWLAVEVRSYRPQPVTAANVYLELTYQDNTHKIVQSDADWEASLQIKSGWETGKDNGVTWQKASIVEKWPWKISAPLFHRGFCSRIEF